MMTINKKKLMRLLKDKNARINALVWAIAAGVYAPILYSLYRGRWESVDYTHAYFILPISLWLCWRIRKKLVSSRTRRAGAGYWLVLLAAGLFLLVFGWRMGYLMISSFSLIPLLFGLTGYLYGAPVAKLLTFPILYLLLMVPPPLGVLDSITLPMRHGISVLTEVMLKALHYPITRDGLLMSIGGHDIYMGAPCSGFRSLITMIALGLVYVYVNKGSFTKKAILLSSVVPLALAGNLARVASMCLVTFYFGDKVGHAYHDYSGYVIFLVLIAGMMGIEAVLNKAMKP
jgi:exosortase